MMTRKDFIALADAIRGHNANCKYRGPFDDGHLDTLERFCRERNPNFLPARWVNYIHGECGPNGGAIRKPKESTT